MPTRTYAALNSFNQRSVITSSGSSTLEVVRVAIAT